MPDLLMGLTQYFQFYNQERQHQALTYKTPDEVSIKRLRAAGQRLWINLTVRVRHQTPCSKTGTAPFSWSVSRVLS